MTILGKEFRMRIREKNEKQTRLASKIFTPFWMFVMHFLIIS